MKRNKIFVKTNEITKVDFYCKKCNNLIQSIDNKDFISDWDYVIPRTRKCLKCDNEIQN